MLLVANCFILGVISSVASLSEFTWPFKFSDGHPSPRHLFIDITSPNSFVLDYETFHLKAGNNNTFDPSKSKTIKRLGQNQPIFFSNGTVRGQVTGAWVKDVVGFGNRSIESSFVIGNRFNPDWNPALRTDGSWLAGRFGLSRAFAIANLKDGVLSQYVHKTWCGEAKGSNGSYTQRSLLGIDPSNLQVIAASFVSDMENNLWRVPVLSFILNGQEEPSDDTIVISTATDAILIPEAYSELVLQALRAAKVGNRYEVQCSAKNAISMNINGKVVDLDYNAVVEKTAGRCYLKIVFTKNYEFVFGLPFFAGKGICLDFKNDEVVFYKPQ